MRLAAIVVTALTTCATLLAAPTGSSATVPPRCPAAHVPTYTYVQPDLAPVSFWSLWAWQRELRELRSVCINRVVLTQVATNDAGSDDMAPVFGPDAATDVVGNLMSAAATVPGMSVILGLQTETGWPTTLDTGWADGAAARSQQVAEDVLAGLPASAPLAGWFLTPEPSSSTVRTAADRAAFAEYASRTTTALDALTPAAQVLVAPAYDTWLPASGFSAMMTSLASVPGVTMLTLQDRTGEPYEKVDAASVAPWFNVARTAVRKANRITGRHVALWSDVEAYRISARSGASTPATTREIVASMDAEAPYVSGFALFSFVHYLSTDGWFPAYAAPYAHYIQTGALPSYAPAVPEVQLDPAGLANQLSWPATTDQPEAGYLSALSYYQLTRVGPDGVSTVLATIRAGDSPSDCPGAAAYCYLDSDLTPGISYEYRLSAVNGVGNSATWDQTVATATLVGADDLGVGRPYELDPQPAASYPDRGGRLTDGEIGPADDQDSSWMGWADTAPTITVDLGIPQPVSAVTSTWLQQLPAWVVLPDAMSVSVSADGSTWTDLGTVAAPSVSTDNQVVAFTVLGDPAALPVARYVRVRVTSNGGWLFASEITVHGPNAPAGTSHYTVSRPAAADYPDLGGTELADGALGTPDAPGDPAWAGWWQADGLSVTSTLAAPQTVAGLDVDCLDLPSWGIQTPDAITVAVSTDGVRYVAAAAVMTVSDTGTVSLDLAEPVDQVLSVRVRFTLQPATWLFLGEVTLR